MWIGDRTAARVGYGWEMSNINLHAISRDTSAFPEPCLYCQVRLFSMKSMGCGIWLNAL